MCTPFYTIDRGSFLRGQAIEIITIQYFKFLNPKIHLINSFEKKGNTGNFGHFLIFIYISCAV